MIHSRRRVFSFLPPISAGFVSYFHPSFRFKMMLEEERLNAQKRREAIRPLAWKTTSRLPIAFPLSVFVILPSHARQRWSLPYIADRSQGRVFRHLAGVTKVGFVPCLLVGLSSSPVGNSRGHLSSCSIRRSYSFPTHGYKNKKPSMLFLPSRRCIIGKKLLTVFCSDGRKNIKGYDDACRENDFNLTTFYDFYKLFFHSAEHF